MGAFGFTKKAIAARSGLQESYDTAGRASASSDEESYAGLMGILLMMNEGGRGGSS